MKILIAEDDSICRHLLETILKQQGYYPIVACDGNEAWQILLTEDSPRLAIIDRVMPGIDGLDICRKAKELPKTRSYYIIILTSKDKKEDIVEGLIAGADDYVTKPFNHGELCARVQVGMRILNLQQELADRIEELEKAVLHIKQLQGLLPMCSYCKKIRDDQNYWWQVESYITKHSDAQFSHGICPDCFKKIVEPELEAMKSNQTKSKLPF
jgi:sigma-B regulation protein RsbU (phosphoserine phosphatase)